MGQIRDIVVIGASAGGVEALCALVARLPADIPAALFIVLHVSPTAVSILPEILSRKGPLPAEHPANGTPITHGHIYIAPPDRHLMVGIDKVVVRSGPKLNGYRPSINMLFCSAAEVHCSRTVGVVLSGALDDGASGILTIHEYGGYAIVQDPAEARYTSMPLNAISRDHVDEILPVEGIAARLVELATICQTPKV